MDAYCPWRSQIGILLSALALSASGCLSSHHALPDPSQPRELSKTTLPDYVIEAPDILKIDALQLIPLPPYKVQSLDVLALRVLKTLPDEPIVGLYTVEPDGTINLGVSYGRVKLLGVTLDEAKNLIEKQLLKVLKAPQIDVAVAQARGVQQIRGEHLVRPDGTVSLGSYGSVKVAGLTLREAKTAIESHLKLYLQQPEVVVDVLAYNSKVYYVVFDQGGAGQRIFRLPITGNETVLDAISQVSGLSSVSDEKKIWLARPSREEEEDEVLPVDWKAVTTRGRSGTNYQLLPGDRVFIQAQPMVAFDTRLARFLTPFERMFGFTLLGNSTVQALRNTSGSSGGSSGSTP
jgi:polysaccharide biosynthesis/export protein